MKTLILFILCSFQLHSSSVVCASPTEEILTSEDFSDSPTYIDADTRKWMTTLMKEKLSHLQRKWRNSSPDEAARNSPSKIATEEEVVTCSSSVDSPARIKALIKEGLSIFKRLKLFPFSDENSQEKVENVATEEDVTDFSSYNDADFLKIMEEIKEMDSYLLQSMRSKSPGEESQETVKNIASEEDVTDFSTYNDADSLTKMETLMKMGSSSLQKMRSITPGEKSQKTAADVDTEEVPKKSLDI